MARTPKRGGREGDVASVQGVLAASAASSFDTMLLEAVARGDDSLKTGRFIVTHDPAERESAGSFMQSLGLKTADARDFDGLVADAADVGSADTLFLPEIGVEIISAQAAAEHEAAFSAAAADTSNPISTVEPEYFAFTSQISADFLLGFRCAVEALTADLAPGSALRPDPLEVEAQVAGATWGLTACKVPASSRNGAGVRVAVLDTGMDLYHPDFAGRQITGQTFVGQPVQDLHGHGTHCIGTSCGTLAPPASNPRYGIAHQAAILAGKVLSNSGSGATGGILAGINWAIANQCTVISMSLGSQSPIQAAYTAAGQAALGRGCLIVAAAGNAGMPTGSPANSPTIMAVASLDQNLRPSSFSDFGKIDIAAPGRDVFSSAPMPQRYATMSGTSMATPHVAGCAALWAQTAQNLRGQQLWNRLTQTARKLPLPPNRVGAGLVQAPA